MVERNTLKELNQMLRLKTGIKGLDEVVRGGYPQGTNILITGPSGSGKTIFCMQFLYKGVEDYEEHGIFVTLEEHPRDLRKEMASLGWDIEKFEGIDGIVILDAASSRAGIPAREKQTLPEGFDIDSLLIEIYKTAKRINAKRIVIDSIPSLELRTVSEGEVRRSLYRLSSLLLETRTTSLLTTESVRPNMISRFGFEEFLCRGVIELMLEEHGLDLKRTLRVRKMRGTEHSMKRMQFEIGKDGIVVFHS